ncbi:hypothetical protein BGLT_04093 [Caballeronia glathei]|jgi:hypothetical protein|uniref:Uncharacterized protein n=1 Tax=Caballeronia glathei TaxID=60547 RepID=A0A069PRS5_9BURK|nr:MULTISPECIES: hypothetical protein [Burkholderiaceae]KDR43290.1 hypothetical protein BG61_40730 [Caballeronia glathei]TCK39491.1 hypothetical protein B0G84_4829 [Paraburkholderia sp. BL8N3]CDY75195.1 hypothetical protein BGLT_04093 [Caballeronia glathei]
MDTITHATVVTWLEDAETHGDDYAPISHSSSQVCERPEYVAEVFGRFASETSDDGQNGRVVRGYN